MAISLAATVRRSPDIMHSDLGDQVVMMDIEAGAYFGLNAVGARIWAMAEQPIALAAIVDRLLEDFDVARGECAEAVERFTTDLVDAGILQVVEAGAAAAAPA